MRKMCNENNEIQCIERFEANIYGKATRLLIKKYETKRGCVEIVLQTGTRKPRDRKSIAICLLAVINLIFFYLELFNHSLFLIIFAFVSYITVDILGEVKSERLMIIKSLGIQFTVSYYFGTGCRTLFIPWNSVKKIFINEVITMQKVLHILTIMITEDKKGEILIPIFKSTSPRLKNLELIYEEIIKLFVDVAIEFRI